MFVGAQCALQYLMTLQVYHKSRPTLFSLLFFKHLVHKSLISCTRILQAKRHYLVAIYFPLGQEGCLLLIVWMHQCLIIPKVGIQEAHKLMSNRCIHQHVYHWKRETIVRTCLFKICEVNINYVFPILPFHQNYIRQSIWVLNFSDHIIYLKSINLLINHLIPLRYKSSSFMLHQFELRIGIQLVGDYRQVDYQMQSK